MRNRNVGYLITGLAVVMAVMVFLFNSLIKTNIGLTCSHGPTCEMYNGLAIQTWVSIAVVAVVFLIGLFLIFSKEEKEIIVKKIKEKKKKISLEGLNASEKEAVKLIGETGGIFQAELMEKLGIGKVGVTRLLDKLEAKQIVERKRRGMNNFVVMK